MYRVLIAVACVLVASDTTWAARRVRCRPSACCQPKACAACANRCQTRCSKSYVDPCYCLLEPIATYPVPGGTETLYLGERHDDGCHPEGYCQAPSTVYLTDPDPDLPAQDCGVEDDCSSGAMLRPSNVGLKEPVLVDYKPEFVERLKEIAKIIHTDYLVFDAGPKGWIRAKVFIIELPHDLTKRPAPHRMIAIGYEVEVVPGSKPTYKVDRKYVTHCEKNEHLYCVTVGGVTYGLITVP